MLQNEKMAEATRQRLQKKHKLDLRTVFRELDFNRDDYLIVAEV